MGYQSGDYYVLCARCGCKTLRSQTIQDVGRGQDSTKPHWLVCKKHMDGVHPQTKRVPFIGDPTPLPSSVIRTENVVFRSSDVWNFICENWEDIERDWETMNKNENTVEEISKTLNRSN